MTNSPPIKDTPAKGTGSALRRILGISLIAGAAYAVWRAIEANRAEHDTGWRSQPFPFPPEPRPRADAAVDSAAVDPDRDRD